MSKYRFSLVMPTYGRNEELRCFLDSLVNCDYDNNKFEVIIIDQNDKIDLNNIIEYFRTKLNIKYVKSTKKGLSLNRNIGLEYAEGDIISFPDDDCKYLKDTLSNVDKLFEENSEVTMFLGRIVDENDNDSLRRWPKKIVEVNKMNFYKKVSSITMFIRLDKHITNLYFDIRFGVGNYFGSNEDSDVIYRFLKKQCKITYNPLIKIYHPNQVSENNMNKIVSYSLGFGAFCRKHIDFVIIIQFMSILSYHFLKLLYAAIKFNFIETSRRNLYIKYRLKGFKEFGGMK